MTPGRSRHHVSRPDRTKKGRKGRKTKRAGAGNSMAAAAMSQATRQLWADRRGGVRYNVKKWRSVRLARTIFASRGHLP